MSSVVNNRGRDKYLQTPKGQARMSALRDFTLRSSQNLCLLCGKAFQKQIRCSEVDRLGGVRFGRQECLPYGNYQSGLRFLVILQSCNFAIINSHFLLAVISTQLLNYSNIHILKYSNTQILNYINFAILQSCNDIFVL